MLSLLGLAAYIDRLVGGRDWIGDSVQRTKLFTRPVE